MLAPCSTVCPSNCKHFNDSSHSDRTALTSFLRNCRPARYDTGKCGGLRGCKILKRLRYEGVDLRKGDTFRYLCKKFGWEARREAVGHF